MEVVKKERMILPTANYELIDSDDVHSDGRFKKVKIFIAHTEENLNYTNFSKTTLTKMKDTLTHVPIVGYIKENDNHEIDFSGHEQKITITSDGIDFDYIGVPFGFIPEEHNASFEVRDGKEWLTAEGYLWTKFNKAIDLFDKSNGRKSHSMEIENIEGFADDEGIFHVENALFSALCILGDEVLPGMSGSTIEYFSKNSIKDEIREMLAEFSTKGDDENVSKEDLNKNIEPENDGILDEGKVKDANSGEENQIDNAENQNENSEDVTVNIEPENAEEPEATEPEATPETQAEPEIQEDNSELEEANAKLFELEAEVKELREYKANVERAEKTEILNEYTKELPKSTIEELAKDIDKYSIQDFEKEIAYRLFKSEKEENDLTAKAYSYTLNANNDTEDFGSLKAFL